MTSTQTLRVGSAELRLLTYLAPGLPLSLFEAVGEQLQRDLGIPTRLACDSTRSGPEPGSLDPFTAGTADIGFLCAPGYLWMKDRSPPAVELVPAAFAFDDERCQGRPVYFADLVVALDSPVRSLDDLRGARWVYNDPCSLSGYFSVLAALAERGAGPDFFGSMRMVGSHHAALRAIEQGEADCAAIDSNTLLIERRAGRAPRVHAVASFGPFPVQPVVVRAELSRGMKAAIARTLLGMHADGIGGAALASSGVRRFMPIDEAEYEFERWLIARARSCSSAAG